MHYWQLLVVLLFMVAQYSYRIWRYGSTVTPDGVMYSALGRGERVPRPYSYRLLARCIRSPLGWRLMHAFSTAVFGVACFFAIAHHNVDAALPLTVLLLTLPSLRQSIGWPILVDMPSMAAVAVAMAIAPHAGVWLLLWFVVCALVTERTALLAVVACYPYADVSVVAVGAAIAVAAAGTLAAMAPTVGSDLPYLRNPIKDAWAWHMQGNLTSWLLPWGGLVAAVGYMSIPAALMAGLCYAQCAVARDRARLYVQAALPIAICLVGCELWLLYLLFIFTALTPITEV